jgi:CYTH domain-containing protein
MIERERKFLLKRIPNGADKTEFIIQGYLMLDSGKQFRVRTSYQKDINQTEASIAFKVRIDDETKKEFEFPIELSVAKEMMECTKIIIEKKRTTYNEENYTAHLDEFEKPFQCRFVEIEYPTEDTSFVPDFCAEEITSNKKYSNIAMAKRNAE